MMHRISPRVIRLAVSGTLALAIGAAAVPSGFAAGSPPAPPTPPAKRPALVRPGAPAVPYILQGDVTNPPGSAATYFDTTGSDPNGDWTFSTEMTDGTTLRANCLNGPNCTGVYAGASGIGVRAVSSGTYGVFATAIVTGATGVRGDGDLYGLYGTAASTSGIGVYGTSGNVGVYGIGNLYGVEGYTTAPGAYAVYGSDAEGSTGGFAQGPYGAQGLSVAPGGFGMYATALGTGTTYGLFADVVGGNSASVAVYGANIAGYGVIGYTTSAPGVYGVSNSSIGVIGSSSSSFGLYGSSISSYGVVGSSTSSVALRGSSTSGAGLNASSASGYGLIANSSSNVGAYVSTSTGTKALWAVNSTVDATHFALYVDGNARVNGSFHATGTCCSAADTAQGPRQMYANEAARNLFSDEGSAQLVHGRAVVPIDPLFAQTVNLGAGYDVFVTPHSLTTAGLGVVNMTATSFEVGELNGGTGTFRFTWRIDALRKGYEALRMAPAPAAPETPLPPAAPVTPPRLTLPPVPPAPARPGPAQPGK